MCGIIAITGNNAGTIENGRIDAMLSTLSKRGPDDKGFVREDRAIIGQTRLSIVDIGGGHQPMKDTKNPYTIVFNGEMYGYKDLRGRLELLGHSFSTQSDTEVILKAYAEYGDACLDQLDGMFVFALWDDIKKELFIARDRFGKKPFYYTFIDKTFFGASEIKALFATGKIKGKIDPGALEDYLRLSYIPPNKSIYSNIHVLPPAHVATIKDGNIRMRKYWDLEKKEVSISFVEAKKTIKKLFDLAVQKRMVADVEIGSLLSGGIDSTLVTLYAQKYASHPIKTFAVGYDKGVNELPFALEASKKIGTDHFTLTAQASDIEELRNVIEYFDEPHADSSNFPQHLISKLASTKVKVALSGDGADELFMGYGWYQKYWNTPLYKKIFENPFSSYRKMVEVFDRKERAVLIKKRTLIEDEFESLATSGAVDSFDKINRYDLKIYLPGQLLTKIDRTSMMHSLEVRSPFLDTALVEFVYNLPWKFKINKTENKIILKDILSEIMPKDFVYRRKQGFGAPIVDWLKEKVLQDEIHKILTDNAHPMYKYLDRETVRKIIEKKDRYTKSSIRKIWSILCLGIWFELHYKDHE